MKLSHLFSFTTMVIALFFSVWAKTQIKGWLGFVLIGAVALLCGTSMYFVNKDIKNERNRN